MAVDYTRMLTLEEVASVLKIDGKDPVRAVRRIVRAGTLKAYRVLQGHYLVDRRDLDAYVEARATGVRRDRRWPAQRRSA
jgi:excisionase family DNA binding protein